MKSRFPWWLSGKESVCQCRRCGLDPWVQRTPRSRKWKPTPVFLPGKAHGHRSLVGYSPWGHKRVRHNLATTATTMKSRYLNQLFNVYISWYILANHKLKSPTLKSWQNWLQWSTHRGKSVVTDLLPMNIIQDKNIDTTHECFYLAFIILLASFILV